MTGTYEAVVFDLDGTLVDLDVDWDAARRDAAAALKNCGVDVDGLSLWGVLETAEELGHRDPVASAIAEHEREGARTAMRLSTADALPLDVPTGVCSLNCESACRLALERHELAGHVEAVVGRDTTTAYKPDPAALIESVRLLGADPDRTLFVGDSERDAETAREAGIDFRYVEEWVED